MFLTLTIQIVTEERALKLKLRKTCLKPFISRNTNGQSQLR